MIDLHTHTTASDGVLSPEELVAAGAAAGVTVLAVTDHDTTAGVAAASAAAGGLRVVPGVELSCSGFVHILGLFVDPAAAALSDYVEQMRAERLDRARRIVARLNELGYTLSFDDVLAQARGQVVGRPHIARALVAAGHVRDVDGAFTPALIANGGLADVPRTLLTPQAAVALVRRSGGAAVVAHPVVVRGGGTPAAAETLIDALVPAGLAGVEVDHPNQAPETRASLRSLVVARGLVATGGSDFHDPQTQALGTCTTSPSEFDRLEAAAGS